MEAYCLWALWRVPLFKATQGLRPTAFYPVQYWIFDWANWGCTPNSTFAEPPGGVAVTVGPRMGGGSRCRPIRPNKTPRVMPNMSSTFANFLSKP